jgi:hypothetical protein
LFSGREICFRKEYHRGDSVRRIIWCVTIIIATGGLLGACSSEEVDQGGVNRATPSVKATTLADPSAAPTAISTSSEAGGGTASPGVTSTDDGPVQTALASPAREAKRTEDTSSGSVQELASWVGDYTFFELVPQDENRWYSLSIRQEQDEYIAIISIDGFQTMTRLQARVEGDEVEARLLFDSYRPDNLFEPYQSGDQLLRFKKQGSQMLTYWGKFKPMIPSYDSGKVWFERVVATQGEQALPRMSVYVNERYGYSIPYPGDWLPGEVAGNGDGRELYTNDESQRVGVYASNYLEDISDPFHERDKVQPNRETFTLNNGLEAKLMQKREDDKVHFEVVYLSKKDLVSYHLEAWMTEKLFKRQEPLLREMAKRMEMSE